ncbi:GspH/FimT family pseudopilin [Gilvimarinus sp. SDUM040013]|uniref:Type II secretion system protein H n=1 Tax=Gilvimarinus gilvus TaxID=3058038 RepID=A0ABU4S0K5_9GAMM|nr:GspH/FimT family pseudopilin [Gilvimarinus sp. SDUM040013]MDO3384885.1 GspH/FimT family pseudopilin [Gilvimarinus sp. SDUM040013]MDX6850690.1 GspH/FimT family pseudopilin [Gilvimarinus sp. SDUM040013]
MKPKGFTLIEAISTLLVLAILCSLAAPPLQRLLQRLRVETTMWNLIEATQLTRSYAIKANRRASMRANASWEEGWQIFYDDNHNGVLDAGEVALYEAPELHESVRVEGNRPVADYISYLGTGESRWASGRKGGGFQAGTLTVCPKEDGPGYELVLARGGRLRKEKLKPEEC